MIDLNKIDGGTSLQSRELDQLRSEQQKRKCYRTLLGTVVDINQETRDVTLRLKEGLRMFKPEELWYPPWDERNTNTSPDDQKEKLMAFIVGIHDGLVGTIGLERVAKELRQRGVRPIKTDALIAAL